VDQRKQRGLWASTGHLLLPTSFLQNSLHITMESRGATIDVSSFNGVRCRTCRQHPPRGLTINVSSFGGGRYQTSR
jgi:hypothetical protein